MRPEWPTAGVQCLGRGQPALFQPARGSGERCKLPQRGPRNGAPAAKGFEKDGSAIHYFTQDDLSGQQDGPRRFYFLLASWPSGRARGMARTKMVGPRPYLVYSWRRHWLVKIDYQ